jgi:transposase
LTRCQSAFKNCTPDDISAWIGLVPKQNSSGGKDRLGNISKRGDRYLRSLFTAGALAVIRYAKIRGAKHRTWLTGAVSATTYEGRGDRACQ